VRFSGSAGQVEQTLGVHMVSQGSLYANLDDPEIPGELSQTVVALFGLSNLHQPQPTAASQSSAAEGKPCTIKPDNRHMKPADFWSFYDETSPTGSNNGGTGSQDCIAVLEGGIIPPPTTPTGATTSGCPSSVPMQELQNFTNEFSLAPVNLTLVCTDPSNAPVYATDGEPTLDVEWAHAVAPNTPIRFYVSTYPKTTAPDFDTLSVAVSQNVCGVISSSIDSHGNQCPNLAEIQAFAQVSAQAVVQGQTYFHSAGDFGSIYPCGQPSRYDLGPHDARGARRLDDRLPSGTGRLDNHDRQPEHVHLFGIQWCLLRRFRRHERRRADMGGISRLIAQQINTTPPGRLGNINSMLYQIAAGSSGPIVDVANIGNNCPYDFSFCGGIGGVQSYDVGPGYDLGTGLGSPDIQKLITAFSVLPTATPTPVNVNLKISPPGPKFLTIKPIGVPQSKSFTITNKSKGGVPVTIEKITSTPNFPITNECPATLAAGQHCKVKVTFIRTYPIADSPGGLMTGSVNIYFNSNGSSPATMFSPQRVPILAFKGNPKPK
jgi:hypothetical protein